jgi:hypothetical protein
LADSLDGGLRGGEWALRVGSGARLMAMGTVVRQGSVRDQASAIKATVSARAAQEAARLSTSRERRLDGVRSSSDSRSDRLLIRRTALLSASVEVLTESKRRRSASLSSRVLGQMSGPSASKRSCAFGSAPVKSAPSSNPSVTKATVSRDRRQGHPPGSQQ